VVLLLVLSRAFGSAIPDKNFLLLKQADYPSMPMSNINLERKLKLNLFIALA
jgi:hypothetical protein